MASQSENVGPIYSILLKMAGERKSTVCDKGDTQNLGHAPSVMGQKSIVKGYHTLKMGRVDGVKKKCKTEGCLKSDAGGGHCMTHGGGKRCETEGCLKHALSGGHCMSHGGGRRCNTEGCNKAAQGGGHCIAHGGGKRCQTEGCPKRARASLEQPSSRHLLPPPWAIQ